VTLDRKTLSLVVGGEETLTATVAPDDAADKTGFRVVFCP
jgi:uncharacterized protein YjdB